MESLYKRIKKLAEKCSVEQTFIKMLVYSNYAGCLDTPEQALEFLEKYYDKKQN